MGQGAPIPPVAEDTGLKVAWSNQAYEDDVLGHYWGILAVDGGRAGCSSFTPPASLTGGSIFHSIGLVPLAGCRPHPVGCVINLFSLTKQDMFA